jgi:hypothetical protein
MRIQIQKRHSLIDVCDQEKIKIKIGMQNECKMCSVVIEKKYNLKRSTNRKGFEFNICFKSFGYKSDLKNIVNK